MATAVAIVAMLAMGQPAGASAASGDEAASRSQGQGTAVSPTGIGPIPIYTPKAGVIFNNPTGPVAEKYVIRDHINASIDASPRGSTIRIATYSFDFSDTLDKLIMAHDRGVNVRVLIDGHFTSPQTTKLTTALGRDIKKSSYVRRCVQGCMSSQPSVMHAKIYSFSTAGAARLVSMVGSANLTYSSGAGSWNNINTVVGDSTVYNSLTKYFQDMVRDANDSHYFRTTTSGSKKLYYFPQAASGTSGTIMDSLNKVVCSGSSSGYGYKGHTVIRVAMFQWAASRLDIATKLRQLRDKGCVVEVITNGPIAGAGVLKALLTKSTKYGVMPVYDALYDKDNNGIADLYIHDKIVTISGNWGGNSRTKLVYTGSQNFTINSIRNNNEIIYRLSDAASYDNYSRHVLSLRTSYAKQLHTAPKQTLSAAGLDKLVGDDLSGLHVGR